MASLLIAGTVILANKIKDKKEAKREAKREAYEKRYKELQDDHRRSQGTMALSPTTTLQDSLSKATTRTSDELQRRNSAETADHEDGPTQWVEDVIATRTLSQSK